MKIITNKIHGPAVQSDTTPLVSIQTRPHEQLKAEIFQLHIQEEEKKGKEKK